MAHWEYNASPPYPKTKGEAAGWITCLLKIEDTNKKIDFISGNALFFEVKYNQLAKEFGSIQSYMSQSKNDKKYIFNYLVKYDEPFTISIKSHNAIDLSGLKAELIGITDNTIY